MGLRVIHGAMAAFVKPVVMHSVRTDNPKATGSCELLMFGVNSQALC